MKVSLIGAGGHARTVINILEKLEISISGIYDDQYTPQMSGELIDGYPLLGGLDQIPSEEMLVITKGDCKAMVKLYEQFSDQLINRNLIHPSALVESLQIGNTNQVSAFAYTAKTAKIGSNNIIYSHTSIEHEVEVGDFNVITVNVTICGRAKIGNRCFLGASSTVLPNVQICDNVVIGAGALVIKDITVPGTYVGVPAKKI